MVIVKSGSFPTTTSAVGKKFFSLVPGEIVLASLDGFSKVCDAVEVAGKNFMSITSVVTIGLLSRRYGEQAGKVTTEGLDAAGHTSGRPGQCLRSGRPSTPRVSYNPQPVKAAAQANSSDLKSNNKNSGS